MVKNFTFSQSVINKLESSPFEFYVTGSTFFAGGGNDIDFFTEDSTEVRVFLRYIGFHRLSSTNYVDSNCVDVYRICKGKHSSELVDVQLVKNAELKNRIQNRFKSINILSPTTEQWNLAFVLIQDNN